MRILLIAEEAAGAQMLRALKERAHEVVVAAEASRPATQAATVHQIATTLGFETWDAARVAGPALARDLRDRSIRIALNVHSLHKVHPDVLAALPLGCYNLHPGPLPGYAGLNTPSWAIYRGERSHGVTIHRMDAGIDTGPMVHLQRFPIDATDTGLMVSAKAVPIGVRLMLDLLDTAATDPAAIPLTPQDLSARRYFGREAPDGGRLSWDRPARQVVDHIRAADYRPLRSPWGHPLARIGTRDVGLVAAGMTGLVSDAPPGTVGASDGEDVLVACRDEWVVVRTVQADGGYVPAADILRGVTRVAGASRSA